MMATDSLDVPSAAARRLPALDGLRGVAILLVLMFHIGLDGLFATDNPDAKLIRVVNGGWIGVDLFFVLSGFLITSILLESKAVPAAAFFRNFYARRALRIWPLYIVFALLLMFVLPLVSSEGAIAQTIRAHQIWIWTYTINFGYKFEPAFAQTPYLNHLWSLAIEEQFYLVWPLVVFALRDRALVAVAVVAVVGAVIARWVFNAQGIQPITVYTLTPSRMDDFALGALVAIGLRSPEGRRLVANLTWPLTLAGFAVFVTIYAVQGSFLPNTSTWTLILGISAVGFLFTGLVAAAVLAPPRSAVAGVLGNRVLTMFGKYSYALYVFHYPVGLLLLRHSHFAASVPSIAGSTFPGAIAFAAVAMAITFALSIASWHLLEQPFLRLRGHFPQGSVLSSIAGGPQPRDREGGPNPRNPVALAAVLSDKPTPVPEG